MMWSAVVLGLLGSVHCLAMCGPLVIALNSKKQQTLVDKVYYNGGRILSYGAMGLIAGLVGGGIGLMVGQQYLSIFTGVLLLLGLLVSWMDSGKYYLPISKLFYGLKSKMSNILTGHPSQQWLFGIYNGLLPCGLTYVALAAAVATGNLFDGVLYMVLFGIGTGPMMWLIASSISKLKLKSGYGGKIISGFTMMLAFLLIIRGLGLGIPYLSPDTNHHHETHIMKGH